VLPSPDRALRPALASPSIKEALFLRESNPNPEQDEEKKSLWPRVSHLLTERSAGPRPPLITLLGQMEEVMMDRKTRRAKMVMLFKTNVPAKHDKLPWRQKNYVRLVNENVSEFASPNNLHFVKHYHFQMNQNFYPSNSNVMFVV
jgi:hypothetical protein